ncbi:hypothetical protein HF086_002277, partial [Spodoptera exigua]
MSDREGPSGSGSQGSDKGERNTRSSAQPMPTGSSYYASEPIQFRVRGSTITGASPPKFVTLEDIMKAAHGMQNMALAHEIAVDQDFKLEPFEPPDNSYQKLVKETMHKAYFDILREQLNSDPPEYKQALVLLEDGLFSILLPRHTRIREMIEEVLDADFIRQQAENNSLDFHKYASFVIDLMAKLAAPARDEMIQNITKLTDTVDVFRAILETLEILKLDLANTLIAMIRPHVQQESVQYERAKELKQVLPSLAEEIILVTEQLLENLNQSPLTGETKEIIRTQILSLGDPEHRVREIVRQRVLEFLKTILVCGGGSRQIPVGLSALARELTSVSGTLL